MRREPAYAYGVGNQNPCRYASAKALTRKAYPFNEKAETTTIEGFLDDPGIVADGNGPAAQLTNLFHIVTEMAEPTISDGTVCCPIENVRFWDDCTLELHYAVKDGITNTGRCLTINPHNMGGLSGSSNGTGEMVHGLYVACRDAVPYHIRYCVYDSRHAEVDGAPNINAAMTRTRHFRTAGDVSILEGEISYSREHNIRAAALVRGATLPKGATPEPPAPGEPS